MHDTSVLLASALREAVLCLCMTPRTIIDVFEHDAVCAELWPGFATGQTRHLSRHVEQRDASLFLIFLVSPHSFIQVSFFRLYRLLVRFTMDEDPINTFFTSKEAEDPKLLYTVLAIPSTASVEEVRKAYRKKALLLHPDKHTSKSSKEKEELGKDFQRVGFAYAVLSDETRRKRSVWAIAGLA